MTNFDLGTARGTIELDASSLGRAQAAFANLGAALLGFSAVTVGGFGLIVKAGADFAHIMSALEAVSGATGAEMEALSERALALGSSTTYSAGEVGRAMEQLAKAGLSIPEILGGATDATVALAAAAGDELPGGIDRAAEVIVNAMKIFGASADELDHFADVMVGAAASSTISVDDLATTLTYAGPIAAATGINIDDLSAAIALLGDRGIRGSTAGTSLRGVLISLGGASGPARAALTDLGIITADGTNRFYDLNGALKPLPEVMQILGDATRNLSDEERIATFNAIFQRRAMNAAMIMAEAGAEGFNEYAAAIAGIDAGDVAATKLDNLQGDMLLLKNSANALAIAVGLELQEGVRGFVQALTDLVHWLQTLDPEMLATVVRAVAIAGAVAGVAGALALMTAAAIAAYRQFVLLKAGLVLVMGAVRLLSATLLLSPWTWVVLAVIALGAAIYYAYQKVEPFRELVDRVGRAIRDFFVPYIELAQKGIEALVAAFRSGDSEGGGFLGFMSDVGAIARTVYNFFTEELLPGILGFFEALSTGESNASGFLGFMQDLGVGVRNIALWLINVAIPAIVDFAGTVASVLGPIIAAVGRFIVDTLVPGFVTFIGVMWEVIQVVGGALATAFSFFVEEILPRLIWLVQEVAERFVSAFQWIREHVWPVLVALGELFMAVFNEISGGIGRFIGVVQTLGPIWILVWNRISTVIQNAWAIIKGVFDVFINIVTTLWRNFGDNLWSAILIVWDTIQNIVETALRFIEGIIQIVTGLISGDWSKVWEGIRNVFGSIWDFISAVPGRILDIIFLVIRTALDAILSIWQIAWNAVKAVLSTAWQILLNTVGEKIAGVIGFFVSLPGNIIQALGNLAGLLLQKGIHIVQGMFDGIIQIWQDVNRFFRDVPGYILDRIGDLGRTLYNAGLALMRGLKDGIVAGVEGVYDFVSSIGERVMDLKGPPSYDKVMLKPQGKMIMQGLAAGIMSQLPALTSLLQGIAPMIQGAIDVSPVVAIPTMAASGAAAAGVVLTLQFNGPYGADAPDAIRRSLSDPDALSALTQAIRAGVGRN